MIATLGLVSLGVALVGALVLAYRGLAGLRHHDRAGWERFAIPVGMLGAGSLAGFLLLEYAIVTDDFSLEYVASHSSTTTPFLFKLAAAWAALEGSIVLWGLVLAGYVVTVFLVYRRRTTDPLWAGALGVLGVVAVFFFGMMVTVADPFRVCVRAASIGCAEGAVALGAVPQVPPEGYGPNALLQNHLLMAGHPPTLYLGYVGFTVPFAFAMAALVLGRVGGEWLRVSRVWTLVAWVFLTLGIFLGGLWSYEVLGWGGYWAWDPVENASLIPWLVGTAFIHSSIVQMRRGMLQSWNFLLVIAAFAATILGTFLTRSGVISSVHSFTQSPVGPVLLWFLMVVLVVSLVLFARRIDLVSSSPRLEAILSREGLFLLNNLLLGIFGFTVLFGTLYPLFVEAATGSQVSVGRPFYDRIAIPLSVGLLVVMAIGSVTPYRAPKPQVVWDRVRPPVLWALTIGAVAALLGVRTGWVLLAMVLCSFVLGVIGLHLMTEARTRAVETGRRLVSAVVAVLRGDARYWGGQLSHAGVAILALGVALSSNLGVRSVVSIEEGQSVPFAGVELRNDGTFSRLEPNRAVSGVAIAILRDGVVTEVLEPRLNDYESQGQVIATPTVAFSFAGDLYLTLDLIEGDTVRLKVYWFPFQFLVWLGSTMAALGPMWGWLGRRRSVVPRTPQVGVTA